ncbi:hypothetical protein LPB136_04715 [Tenacibaculum todarodis]|uniref:Glycosyltransferase 2-like domain-containing protein n=1 Tax=Tenacibaculum todarodis TaxID=1850252 RepID=A0A1L3JHW6_9FLAO|nr:hypothetical protein [Tenacibaculum todarodis]APG64704.1 hypothetical protein LPB136_04715 [Tenacibaculum todarodis]
MRSNFLKLYIKKKLFIWWDFYNSNFNKIVREQIKDYKKIPIVIINFNQLENLKKLVSFLIKFEYNNIVIIDNLSTYPPLLEYYSEIENTVSVLKNKKNQGHRVFWNNKEYFNFYGKGYYVVTDPDVIPIEKCPQDFLSYFKKKLDSNKDITKVGFSLKIDDLPNHNSNKEKVINWEKKFWVDKDLEEDYIADIDTTFALYRPKQTFKFNNFYRAIRTKTPFLARHMGWYLNNKNLTNEEIYYMKTASKSGSWRVDENGVLIEKHYDEK